MNEKTPRSIGTLVGTLAGTISMAPEIAMASLEELHRLNENLERLAPTLETAPEVLSKIRNLTEVLEDIRAIAAPHFGYRVVEKKK